MVLPLIMSIVFGISTLLIWKFTRDNISPSYVMFFVWTFYMLMLTIFNKNFYALDVLTCLVYWIGANCFLAGAFLYNGLFRTVLNKNEVSENRLFIMATERRWSQYQGKGKKITVILWLVIITLSIGLIPFYFQQITLSGADIADLRSFFWMIRRAELADGTSYGFSIVNNLPVISRIAVIYFFYLYKVIKKNRIPTLIIFILSVVYCLLTGGRAELIKTMLALIGIEVIFEKKWLTPKLVAIASIMLIISSVFAYFFGKSFIDNNLPFLNNMNAIKNDIVIYMLGGVVAFKNVMNGTVELPYNGGVFRFFIQTANSLGADFEIPSLFMPFSYINDGLITNVYTMYGDFSLHSGLVGICLCTFILGFVINLIYSGVKAGKTVWIILYAQMISNIIMTGYSDGFYKSLNFQIKLIILVFIFEYIIRFNKKVKFVQSKHVHV